MHTEDDGTITELKDALGLKSCDQEIMFAPFADLAYINHIQSDFQKFPLCLKNNLELSRRVILSWRKVTNA